MADQAFINALAQAFAKEFGGRSDPTLDKKIKDIRDEIAKSIGSIKPGQLSTSFTGNLDISSLLTPSISQEAYKKNIRLRMEYDRLTKVLLNRVSTYVTRSSKLLTGTIEIGSTMREILGGDKKTSFFTKSAYNKVAQKLLKGIGQYVDTFAENGNIATGKLKIENAVANILNVDGKYSFFTRRRYNDLARKLLHYIGEFVDKKGSKLFTGKIEATDAITSLLAVDKKWSFWTSRSYNKLSRKLLDHIGKFIDNNASNLIKGKVNIGDIIPTLLGDAENSWWTRKKFNNTRRKLLSKIDDFVDNGLQFKTDPVDALSLLDIHSSSLGDRNLLKESKVKIHETFFKRIDSFVKNDLQLMAPQQNVIDLLNIHAAGFIDRAGIKQGFKQSVKAFFDRLKDHITNAKIRFKSEFKFDPLELVTIADTDKKNLNKRYTTAVERYMTRIVQKLETGVINLKSLELPDNIGQDIAKAIANKVKKATVDINAVGIVQQAPPSSVSLPPQFGSEEKIFDSKVTRTMLVGKDNRVIDIENIFCGCIDKLGVKLDKFVTAFKSSPVSSAAASSGDEEGSIFDNVISTVTGGILAKMSGKGGDAAGSAAGTSASSGGGSTSTQRVPSSSKPTSVLGRAGKWLGTKFTAAKNAVVNTVSSAKKALFSKLGAFAGGAKGYLKYIFKIPIISAIFTTFFAGVEILEITNNSEMTRAEKEQAIGAVVIKSFGLLLGGAAGAAILTPIPGGTIIGGILGSLAGQYIGEWIASNIDARSIGKLVIDLFGLNVGLTKESSGGVESFEQSNAVSAAGTSSSGISGTAAVSSATSSGISGAASISSATIPKISNDYSAPVVSSSKTTVDAIRSSKASDPIKQLNSSVQNLSKVVSSGSSSIGSVATPKSRVGNTGASSAFNGGGGREPAYNVRISAWSRLRPGSIMS
jgi:hypothetical protein